jgi:hypothetical protein
MSAPMKNSPSDTRFPPERRSKCAEESRRYVEARQQSLSPTEKSQHAREFNAGLRRLISSGHFGK